IEPRCGATPPNGTLPRATHAWGITMGFCIRCRIAIVGGTAGPVEAGGHASRGGCVAVVVERAAGHRPAVHARDSNTLGKARSGVRLVVRRTAGIRITRADRVLGGPRIT